MYENFKLSVSLHENLSIVGELLLQIAIILGMDTYVDYYCRDFHFDSLNISQQNHILQQLRYI